MVWVLKFTVDGADGQWQSIADYEVTGVSAASFALSARGSFSVFRVWLDATLG